MKRSRLVFILAFTFIIGNATAQTLLNAGFESWITTPQAWEDPEGWISSNSGVPGGDSAVYKTTDSYNGTYAAEIRTLNLGFSGLPYAGALVNGPTNNDLISSGTPIAYLPAKLSGYYKYSSFVAGDSAHVIVILKKYNVSTNERDTIGIAMAKLGVAAVYTNFEINITEIQSGITPDSIIVAFYSSDPDSASSYGFYGARLLIDEVSVDTLTGIAPMESIAAIDVFPNPVMDNAIINIPGGSNRRFELTISDVYGRMIKTKTISAGNTRINMGSMESGMYVITIAEQGKKLISRKVIKL